MKLITFLFIIFSSLSFAGDYQNDNYEDEIFKIEGEVGPYAPQLVDLLVGFSYDLSQQYEYDEAIKLLDRSIHLTKINEGLYTYKQLELIFMKMKILLKVGNIEGLLDSHKKFSWVYLRLKDKNVIQISIDLVNWYVELYDHSDNIEWAVSAYEIQKLIAYDTKDTEELKQLNIFNFEIYCWYEDFKSNSSSGGGGVALNERLFHYSLKSSRNYISYKRYVNIDWNCEEDRL